MRALADRRTGTMPIQLYPCDTCGGRGVRRVAFRSYCPRHLAELYASFDPAVFVLNGVGLQDGRLYPEYGDDEALLRCNHCDATWVGVPGDKCRWCQTRRALADDDLANIEARPEYVAGWCVCDWCRRIAEVDEWEICGEHDGRIVDDEGNTHYCNGFMRRLTRREAERLVMKGMAA